MDESNNLFTVEAQKIEHVKNAKLSCYASIGVGGRVKAAFFPKRLQEMVFLIRHLKALEQRFLVLGAATNVLPSDEDLDLVVIFTTRLTGTAIGAEAFAFCGERTVDFLNACQKENLTGAEFLEGIPATIGGAAFMNAGACGKRISDVIKSVLVYHEDKVKLLPVTVCDYSYKHSLFMSGGYVILGATFSLKKAEDGEVLRRRKEYAKTRENLPAGKSMGCVFKNPLPNVAGKLVEGAGLKGMRIGDAHISSQHANFIINGGRATAGEIKQLIALMKGAVQCAYGIQLNEEIQYIE